MNTTNNSTKKRTLIKQTNKQMNIQTKNTAFVKPVIFSTLEANESSSFHIILKIIFICQSAQILCHRATVKSMNCWNSYSDILDGFDCLSCFTRYMRLNILTWVLKALMRPFPQNPRASELWFHVPKGPHSDSWKTFGKVINTSFL